MTTCTLSTYHHELYTPTHLLTLCALLILGSRGQGHGILVIENGPPNHKTHPMCQGYFMNIQRPERVFVICFLCVFDVTITCSKMNYHWVCVFKVDSLLNSTTNFLSKSHEYQVDSTPLHSKLHSTPWLHSKTPLRKLHGAYEYVGWNNYTKTISLSSSVRKKKHRTRTSYYLTV